MNLSTFAAFNGIINHDYIVVHSAPPRVVTEIVGFMKGVSLEKDGLYIPLEPKK